MSPHGAPYRVPSPPLHTVAPLATCGQRLRSVTVDTFFLVGPLVPTAVVFSIPSGTGDLEGFFVGAVSVLMVLVALLAEVITVASSSRTLGMRYLGLTLAHSRAESAGAVPSPGVFLFDVLLVFVPPPVIALTAAAAASRGIVDPGGLLVVITGAAALAFVPNLAGLFGREARTLADRVTDVRVVAGDELFFPVRRGGAAVAWALAIDLLLFGIVAIPSMFAVFAEWSKALSYGMEALLPGAAGMAVVLAFAAFEVTTLRASRQTVGMRMIGVRTRGAASQHGRRAQQADDHRR